MNLAGYILLAAVVIWAIGRFRRDLDAGMGAFLAAAVFMPGMLEIGLPSALPQITVQRILLLIALLFLAQNGVLAGRDEPVPYRKWFILFGLAQVISFLCGVAFLAGLKGCVDYLIEAFLFFTLLTAYLQKGGSAIRLLSAVCHGLAAVAVLGTLQKYLHFSIPFAVPGNLREAIDATDISSTYPHRILFGYAMALGTPLAIGLAAALPERGARRKMQAIALILIVADYFSDSRGPWLGLALGLAALAALGGRTMWKKVGFLAVLAAAVLVLRPGVRDTITNLTSSTFEEDSLKGASYQVRWELWNVAWSEVKRTPVRFLFGYGPVSTESMDLTSYWEGREGAGTSVEKIGYTSWDNNYAADLIEYGVVGFLLQVVLFAAIALMLLRNWRRADPATRIVRAAIASACFVFMFAMSNVFIFSPQLKYLFWAVAAIGSDAAWTVDAPWAESIAPGRPFSTADAEDLKGETVNA